MAIKVSPSVKNFIIAAVGVCVGAAAVVCNPFTKTVSTGDYDRYIAQNGRIALAKAMKAIGNLNENNQRVASGKEAASGYAFDSTEDQAKIAAGFSKKKMFVVTTNDGGVMNGNEGEVHALWDGKTSIARLASVHLCRPTFRYTCDSKSMMDGAEALSLAERINNDAFVSVGDYIAVTPNVALRVGMGLVQEAQSVSTTGISIKTGPVRDGNGVAVVDGHIATAKM